MMENCNVQVFSNKEFGSVRTVVIDNEPWFVGKDVATILGYSDTNQAIRKHIDEDDKLTRQFNGSGQSREMYIINESGFYSLILSSKLPNAKRFKKWVTSDVLPAIRKTGGYIYGEENMTDDELVYKAFVVMQNKLEQREQQIQELTAQIESQKPKVEFADQVTKADNCIDISTFAKYLNKDNIPIGRNRLFSWLRERKILMKDNVPYQAYLDAGAFRVIEKTYVRDGMINTYSQTLVTGKGQYAIATALRAVYKNNPKELIS